MCHPIHTKNYARLLLTLAACASLFGACHNEAGLYPNFSTEELEAEEARIEEEAQEEATRMSAFSASEQARLIPNRSLVIRHLPVVNDPVRTQWTGNMTNPADGAWHFGKLMSQMAGPKNTRAFTRRLFQSWAQDRRVNGELVPGKPEVVNILQQWPKRPGGALDMTKAPFRLLAIVNRMDLRRLSKGDAGEGRFVFGLVDPDGNPRDFWVILEYKLPASNRAKVEGWARDWQDLSFLNPNSAAYKNKLQAITNRFTKRNARPGKPNGSAIAQIRTNEIMAGSWELREFGLNRHGHIVAKPVVNTPRKSFNGTPALASWINRNTNHILNGSAGVPRVAKIGKRKRRFLGGAVTNNMDFWSAEGIQNATARHKFSLNTCNGCHGAETSTGFVHIGQRQQGEQASLSGFMTGISVSDPVTGAVRNFNEFQRRKTDLLELLGPNARMEAASGRVH